MEMTLFKTAQFVCGSDDLCLASEVEGFNAGGDCGTIVSVSGTSTAGSFELMVMETDPGTDWGGAASAELDRHTMCLYESSGQRLLDVSEYKFVCRDTTTPKTLWVGVKEGASATATIDITLRWVVQDSPHAAIEVT